MDKGIKLVSELVSESFEQEARTDRKAIAINNLYFISFFINFLLM